MYLINVMTVFEHLESTFVMINLVRFLRLLHFGSDTHRNLWRHMKHKNKEKSRAWILANLGIQVAKYDSGGC